jgi:carboxyl-terminal processing protease
MQEMIDMATAKEATFDEQGFNRSKAVIEVRTKALVARNLYDNEAFYILINDLNPSLKEAIRVLTDGSFEKMKLAYSDFK